jgi:SAM-dependent methyltransferase
MLYRRWVVPPRLERLWGLSPREAEALARKESSDCFACGAKLRARRLTQVLLELYPVGDPPTPAGSARSWAAHPQIQALRIAEINRIEGLHQALAALPGLRLSEYRDHAQPGQLIEGIPSQDLTRLTDPDAAFDLILSSETLEHVPDLSAALAELRRVLKPGGYHLFTAPVRPGLIRTYPRAVVRPDGVVEHLAPPLFHPGGDLGYPVFTEFGQDLPEILRNAGFLVEVRFGPVTEDDLGQVYVTRRPLT